MKIRERFKLSASVFVVIKRDEEVLWLRRSGTGWLDGLYSVPAGALDGGETALRAAAREAREETCVEIDLNHLKLKHVTHCLTEGNEWMGWFYEATHWRGTPRLGEPDKHDDLRWGRLSEVSFPVVPYVRQALEMMENGEVYSEFGWSRQLSETGEVR